MPTFSIVVPCFNAERFLGATLESCLSQTVRDVEVIVVDDGSTDGSPAVAERFARDRRVRLVRQANAGVAAARNAGLAAATGDFVNFVDADDLVEPEKLERQGAVLIENPQLDLVLCDGVVIDREGREIGSQLIDARRFEGPAPLFDVLFSDGQFPPLVPLVRRRVALGAGGFPADRALSGWADTAFWMTVALRAPGYHVLADRLCRYRRHDDNMSADAESMATAAAGAYELLFRNHPTEAARALRRLQRRLGELEVGAGYLRGAVSALTSRLSDEQTAHAAEVAASHRAAAEERVQHLKHLLQTTIAAARRSGRLLAVWGAGAGGRQAIEIVRSLGGDVQVCIDSDEARWTPRSAPGVPIVGPYQFCRSGWRDAFVLVGSAHSADIERQLRAMSLRPFTDYLSLDPAAAAGLRNQPS